jgi:hypothetical protein
VRLLEDLGYRVLGHYEPGVLGWRRANLPFDTGRERSIRPEERGDTEASWPAR